MHKRPNDESNDEFFGEGKKNKRPQNRCWFLFETVRIAGVEIAIASRADLLAAAVHDSKIRNSSPQARLVFDANGHGVSLASKNRKFGAELAQADIIHADGGFLVTASRILAGRPIPERSATTDMIHDFSQSELSHFLLGATEEVNAKATLILQETYPEMKVVGRRNGYFSREEEAAIIDEINTAQPDVLWVGLGKPLEQQFCLRNRENLKVPWVITCGGCYNYITGDYPRAPQWMQDSNLEWLHRMATKPKQLGWRYLTTTPHALWLTLTQTDTSTRRS